MDLATAHVDTPIARHIATARSNPAVTRTRIDIMMDIVILNE
jgi:hypothetical protein